LKKSGLESNLEIPLPLILNSERQKILDPHLTLVSYSVDQKIGCSAIILRLEIR